MRNAFREALRERGFDHDGRPIRNGPSSQTTGLVGTADIIVNTLSIKEKFAAVQQETASLVDTLVRVAQGRSSPEKASGKRKTQAKHKRAAAQLPSSTPNHTNR